MSGAHCATRNTFCMWGKSLTGMGPTVPRGRTRKEAGPDEFACSEVACQDWVPLYHKGESGEETGPIVPVGKNS